MNVNILSNILTTLLNIVTPLIVIPIITSELGISGYGLYYSNIAFVALICILTDFGFNLYIPKAIATSNNKKAIISVINSFVSIKLLVLPVVLYITYLINNESNEFLYSLSLFILFSILNVTPILTGLEKYKFVAFSAMIGKLIVIVSILGTDFSTLGVEKAILIQGIYQVFLFFTSILYLNRLGLIKFKILFYESLLLLKESSGYYFSKLFVNIYQQSSSYLVSLVLSMEQVGIYSVALQLYKVGQSMIGAVSKVLYTSTMKTKDMCNIYKFTRLSIALYLIGLPVVIYLSEYILSLVLTVNLGQIVPLVNSFYISLVFVILSSYFGYPSLVPIGKDNYAHIGLYISSLCYFVIILGFYVAFEINLIVFVAAIIIADFSAMLSRLYYCKKFGIFSFKNLLGINDNV
ncbi:oligosaccharide flippase family protein [Vibrio breoganii]